MSRPDHLSRPEAAAYLSGLLGRTLTVAALEKHAERASGPPYVIVLARCRYLREDLDAWVWSLAVQPGKRRPPPKPAGKPGKGGRVAAGRISRPGA